MKSVAELTNKQILRKLSTPANFTHGEVIAQNGGVELVDFSPLKVIVKVKPEGRQRRTVTLTSAHGRLGWTCTCTSRRDLFCMHCVAAGLITMEETLKGRVSEQIGKPD